MAEDNEREDGQKRPSRPVTAAARRERRAAARPAARKDAASTETETTGEPATKAGPKGKAAEKVRKSRAEAAKAESTAETKGRPTPTRDRKETRIGLFSRILRFLREVVAELRKVIWPTRKQMVTYTAVVLVFVAFMVALIYGIDVGLGLGVDWLFGG